MNPQNQNQQQASQGIIHEEQIISGTIKPRHLAASATMQAGDLYFVNSKGIFQRLAPGTVGQTLKIGSDGLPAWA